MPKDKVNYRARGPRTVLTRQTVGGRANDGGLRIGEMDRDCLIAHGLSQFVKESMIERGDKYYMAVCNNSGTIAVYNESKNIFLSPVIDGPLKYESDLNNQQNVVQHSMHGKNFSIVCVPYAFKLLMQELKTMNIQMRIITEDNVDKLTTLYKGHQTIKSVIDFASEKIDIEENINKNMYAETKRDMFKNIQELQDTNDRDRREIEAKYDEADSYFIEEKPLYNDYFEENENDNFRPTMIFANVIRERGLDKHLADFIISEDGNVNIGGIVKLRDDDNRVSISDYKILGFDKYNRVFTLKALSPNITQKIVTRPLSEIFYRGVEDFPSRTLKMGEDISPDSFDLMLDDTEELKKARENFFDDQDTPEYFRRMAEENKKGFQSSPEVSPDRDVAQGLSPRAAYGPTTPSPPYNSKSPEYYPPSPPFGSHTPDYDPYENELEEEQLEDIDEDDEEEEKTTSVVLNQNKPKLTILSDIEQEEEVNSDDEN